MVIRQFINVIKRMLNMKYAQILLATTLTAAAATSFAANNTTDTKTTEEQKVTVTTQELPATNNPNPNVTTAGPADQPAASEAATEDKDGKKTTKSTSTR